MQFHLAISHIISLHTFPTQPPALLPSPQSLEHSDHSPSPGHRRLRQELGFNGRNFWNSVFFSFLGSNLSLVCSNLAFSILMGF